MQPLSKKQGDVLAFIREHIEMDGYPPTIREIQLALGISSTSEVNRFLRILSEKGRLEKAKGSPRAIRLKGYRVKLVPEGVE